MDRALDVFDTGLENTLVRVHLRTPPDADAAAMAPSRAFLERLQESYPQLMFG